jgi:hypothetical protein
MFCRLSLGLLYCFHLPLCFLTFFDLRFLITPLVSSNSPCVHPWMFCVIHCSKSLFSCAVFVDHCSSFCPFLFAIVLSVFRRLLITLLVYSTNTFFTVLVSRKQYRGFLWSPVQQNIRKGKQVRDLIVGYVSHTLTYVAALPDHRLLMFMTVSHACAIYIE